MKAIVIATTKDRSEWARQCYDSLKDYRRYPVIILDQYEYELGKIRWVLENTTLDEFILLQDSVELKETDWLDEVFDYKGSVSFDNNTPYFMYLGKYQRSVLETVGVPVITTKRQAVTNETAWTAQYNGAAGNTKHLFDLKDTGVFKDHLGRRNMIIENDQLIKYKHIWTDEMIYDY